MSEIYTEEYTRLYDSMYKEKNYEKECDFIEEIFKWFINNKMIRSILDFGCGTGTHLAILKKRGYQVFGVDQSEFMVLEAKKKGLNVRVGDFSKMKFNQLFDSCISMFDAMSYVVSISELYEVMFKVKSILQKGSPFIFQFWNGPAVLSQKPEFRKTEFKDFVKIVSPHLRPEKNLCDVHTTVIKNDGTKIEEVHSVRYFFPDEIKKYLTDIGFGCEAICPLFKPYDSTSEKHWSVVAIAKTI